MDPAGATRPTEPKEPPVSEYLASEIGSLDSMRKEIPEPLSRNGDFPNRHSVIDEGGADEIDTGS